LENFVDEPLKASIKMMLELVDVRWDDSSVFLRRRDGRCLGRRTIVRLAVAAVLSAIP
jgi:hypothetical protein